MEIPNALGGLSLLMDSSNIELKRKLPKFFALVAASSAECHGKVLEAMDYKAKKNHEKTRFRRLVKQMSELRDSRSLTNYLTFLNALINLPQSVEKRTRIREEFIEEGILTLLQVWKNSTRSLRIWF